MYWSPVSTPPPPPKKESLRKIFLTFCNKFRVWMEFMKISICTIWVSIDQVSITTCRVSCTEWYFLHHWDQIAEGSSLWKEEFIVAHSLGCRPLCRESQMWECEATGLIEATARRKMKTLGFLFVFSLHSGLVFLCQLNVSGKADMLEVCHLGILNPIKLTKEINWHMKFY